LKYNLITQFVLEIWTSFRWPYADRWWDVKCMCDIPQLLIIFWWIH